MLLEFYQFSLLPLLHPAPHTPLGNPLTIVHVLGSCIGSLATPFLILYFTFLWLFCNYLLVLLNPSPLHPFSHMPLPPGNHQNTLCIHDSVSVLLVCLVCFLDSIVDRYVFIAILLFIVLIFFFLSPFNISYNIMVWWWWTPLIFSCLGSSLSALQF